MGLPWGFLGGGVGYRDSLMGFNGAVMALSCGLLYL